MNKKKFFAKLVLLISLSFPACLLNGCHAPAVVVIMVAGKLTAIKAGAAVLTLAAAYYSVESAYYDKEKNRLELEGVKNGKRTKLVVKDLTETQIKKILEKGRLEIKFRDGSTKTVRVQIR